MWQQKRSKILSKAPRRKNEALYGLLKYFTYWAIFVVIVVFLIKSHDLEQYPYYPSHFAQYFNTTLSYIIAIVLSSMLIISLIERDTDNSKRAAQKYQKKIFRYLNAILYIVIFLFFLMIFQFVMSMLINDLQSRIIKYSLNEKIEKPVYLQAMVISNPDYQKKISIPNGKSHKSIIDPAPYKIYAKIIVDHISYQLDTHCFLEDQPVLLKNRNYFLKGYDSFLGFKCVENCTLNYQFETANDQKLSRKVLDRCKTIYKNQL